MIRHVVRASVAVLVAAAGASTARAQQTRIVHGKVVDAENQAPIPGVAVLATGTPLGAQTSDSGRFDLRVPPSVTSLTARRIGYHEAILPITASESEVTISMSRDVLKLETQVVTGVATTVSSQNAANNVAVLSTDQINAAPAPTLENAMQGKVPGAIIEANNGGAPGGGLQIQIRGVTSIYANAQPLFVIDGTIINNQTTNSGSNAITGANDNTIFQDQQDNSPNRLADLNPEDIESIEILKGSSASAIYGSKAASGVVVITTKKGAPGKPKWEVTGRAGTFSPLNTLDLRQFPTIQSAEAWGENDRGLSKDQVDAMYGGAQDYQSQLFGGGELAWETDASLRGGTENGNTNYFASGLAKYDNGVMVNTGYAKQAARANISQNFSSAITAGLNLTYTHSVTRRGITGNDNTGIAPYNLFSVTPQFVNLNNPANGYPSNPFGPGNPFQDANLIQTPEEVSRFIGGANLQVKAFTTPIQSLTLTLNGGADLAQQKDQLYAPPQIQIEQNQPLPGVSTLLTANTNYENYSANLIHHFTGLRWLDATSSAGVERDTRSYVNPYIVGQQLVPGQNQYLAAATQTNFLTQTQIKDLSWYAQEQLLLLDQRLGLTAGLTGNRSTSDGDIGKFYYYPKFSGSFRIPQFVGFLNELKVRAAYGRSGTEPDFSDKYTNMYFGTPYSPFINTQESSHVGVFPNIVLGDPSISPETNTEIETGFDATFFKSRAQFSATVYQKRISNVILLDQLAPSYGERYQWLNGGQFTNQGIELSLTGTPIQINNGPTWISTATFYRNYSRVDNVPIGPFDVGGISSSGASTISQFGGFFGSFQIRPGRSVTEIVNESIVNAAGVPLQVGDGQPGFQASFNQQFDWGPLHVYTLLDWKYGGNTINITNNYYDNGLFLLADSAASAKRMAQTAAGLTPYVEPGGYVKLREVTLAYDLPARWTRQIGFGRVSSLRLSLSGYNLAGWWRYSGLDPEVSNFGAQDVTRGQDVTPYPPARSYFFSITAGF